MGKIFNNMRSWLFKKLNQGTRYNFLQQQKTSPVKAGGGFAGGTIYCSNTLIIVFFLSGATISSS